MAALSPEHTHLQCAPLLCGSPVLEVTQYAIRTIAKRATYLNVALDWENVIVEEHEGHYGPGLLVRAPIKKRERS